MIKKLHLFLIFALLVHTTTKAQLHWQRVDSLYAPLPSSFHVFKTIDKLDGQPFIAYYASVKLKDKNLTFTTQTGKGKSLVPYQFYEQEKQPLLVVNGGFFSMETGRVLNMVMRNGKLIAYNVVSLRGTGTDSTIFYYPTRSAFGISRKRKADVVWVFTDSTHRRPYSFEKPVIAKGREEAPSIYDLGEVEWKWWTMRTAVGGGPTLIHDGKIWITNKEEQLFVGEEKDKTPRTAIGYTSDNRLIILVIQGRFPGIAEGASLEQEAKLMKDLGCYEALNLGGGGSSCLLVNGKETIEPSDKNGQRPVSAVFIIKTTETKE